MWFPTIFPLGSWCAWVTEGGQCTRNLTVSGAEMFCYVSLTPRGSTLLCGRHKGKKMVKNSVSRGCTAMYWYETYSLYTAIHWVNVLLPTLESSSMLVLENITSTARKKKKKRQIEESWASPLGLEYRQLCHQKVQEGECAWSARAHLPIRSQDWCESAQCLPLSTDRWEAPLCPGLSHMRLKPVINYSIWYVATVCCTSILGPQTGM